MAPTEPWASYLPEFNAIRQELGPGVATWLASGAMWNSLSAMVAEAMAAFGAEVATLGLNWQGLASTKLTGAVPAYMAWLGSMEAISAANALACYGVAEAYAIARGTMIPSGLIAQNRIEELTAEATNFMGINTGLIALLNGQYAGYWTDNAATMLTYDEAVQLATLPKPSAPPPPLANAMSAAAELAQTAASSATQQATQVATQATQGVEQPAASTTEAVPAAAQSSGEMMSTLLSSGGQLLSAPTQGLSQLTGSGGSPLQSMLSPFQSLLTSFGGSAQDPAAFLTGPASSAFPASLAGEFGAAGDMAGLGAGGAMPLSGFGGGGAGAALTGGGGIGGGGIGGGGGIPAGSMLASSYNGGLNPMVKSQDVFTGVPARGVVPAATLTPGGAMPGGGMAPMMHSPAGTQSGSRRDGDTVFAANIDETRSAVNEPRRA